MRWSTATTTALYGPNGFFTRADTTGPSGHFRTSSTASPLFAGAVARLLVRLDTALGRPDRLDLVEVGAGRGELLTWLLDAVPADLGPRLRPLAVELAARPEGLPATIGWTDRFPGTVHGLLLAVEWLDNVPVDVVEVDAENDADEPGSGGGRAAGVGGSVARYVLVDPAGMERPGPPVGPGDAAWLARWWPLPDAGVRAEIGAPRDAAWADAVARVTAGLAVAVDYGHLLATRPPFGTLTGFRDGREVTPVPDGSCDLTAHVAMDAVAAAGAAVAGAAPVLVTQRTALHDLGVSGARPPLADATGDPVGYLHRLAAAGAAAELTDPCGLGGHTWLLQPVGVDWPTL
jgi:SAM-dependent MidA family methyltransferase